ncbi:MAG: prolyl oligopeptidase family serine peptidase [Victivallaceae bacterium]
MRKYEYTFNSVNSAVYSKPITVLVLEPDNLNKDTGIMLFTHGWGGNRFQHQDKMEYSVDRHNLVCISTEYRMSGYDFNPVTGLGSYRPYDASFHQTFDVLNALREIARLYPAINRKRFYHYGGSQGGHIALLSAVFAPNTFAFVYTSSALIEITPDIREWTGREFMDYELNIRNVPAHADMIKCPLLLEHGTADETVPCDHAHRLENKLTELGKKFDMCYYEGGSHSLGPTITKIDAFTQRAETSMKTAFNPEIDDFSAKSKITINCGSKTLLIDWSQKADSVDLFKWQDC